ncbi:MAG TPA: NAD+ kinase [Thermoanaerobaculia bacterium]|nr:NAD+ kinase [Thermoanaerobaculia bacterium]
MTIERAIVITRSTRLKDLRARFNTRSQAKFYIEQAGSDFSDYQNEDDAYFRAVDDVTEQLAKRLKIQVLDRELVPNFLFAPDTVIVTVGQDGLVANAAKYVGGRPIVAVNPDPARFDGILLAYVTGDFMRGVDAVVEQRANVRSVTMAEATLTDGQRLLAFNDFFIGVNSHVSARYQIRFGEHEEEQSSSGILVSTGAGSTGWMSSVFNMTRGVATFLGGTPAKHAIRLPWDAPKLLFVVREPYASRASGATIVAGEITVHTGLSIESHMPRAGVIFSDGIESDFLQFNSGAIATIGIASEKAQLVAS